MMAESHPLFTFPRATHSQTVDQVEDQGGGRAPKLVTLPIHDINKADMPYSVTSLDRTTIFDRYAVMCGSNNAYQKHMQSNKIGPRAQNIITILNSMVNMIWENMYDQLTSTRNLLLTMNTVFIGSSKNYEESDHLQTGFRYTGHGYFF